MLRTLYPGSRGPEVQLLQLGLLRAGQNPGETDGVFGLRTREALLAFQREAGLTADGIAGPRTHAALRPYYTGYALHTVRRGDSFYRIALRYGTSLRAVQAANPEAEALDLRPGEKLVVPLGFSVVPTEINWCSELVGLCCEGLTARYPLLRLSELGRSVLGRPLWLLTAGTGDGRVFWNACHHANEWITTPLLLKWVEELARAWSFSLTLGGVDARALLERATLSVAPCVNPDGLDLVTGAALPGTARERAREIAAGYPAIPFPGGWKANAEGVDLNLQYPAGWEQAREIKFSQGFTGPAPRDFVGTGPLTAPESRAVYEYTLDASPDLSLSYHSQGRVIYWKYLDHEPPGAQALALRFALASGYLVEDTPFASGFAGYKDWFIHNYNRPGFTIEVGIGDNPLPVSQFDTIYSDNFGLLLESLRAAGDPENFR